MKYLFALALLTAHAVAAPLALDYAAGDASCIDAARFSDEVAAKLGFVPFAPDAAAKIRIRVQRDGDQFTGTFRNVDGSAKIIDGKTCADVTSTLAVTVVTAIDASPKAAPPPAQPPLATMANPVGPGQLPVTFRSAEGRRLSVYIQRGSGVGVASNGAMVAAAYFDPLCTSPCTAGVPTGRSYLGFEDPDANASGGGQYLIDRPTTLTLTHESRRGTRIGLLVGGLAATGVGALWLSQMNCGEGDCVGPIVGGSALISVGVTTMLLSLVFHDTFSVTQSP